MSVSRKLSDQLEAMLSPNPNNNGRRNSAAKIIQRLRSGSLPGWAGGGQIFPMKTAKSSTFDEEDPESERKDDPGNPALWRHYGNANLGFILSAMYAKLLVVLGIGFPMAEVISTHLPPSLYDGFYLYLYFVSIFFMGCIFSQVIKEKARKEISRGVSQIKSRLHTTSALSSTPPTTPPSPNKIKVVVVNDIENSIDNVDHDDDSSQISDEDTDVLSPLPGMERNKIQVVNGKKPVVKRCTTFTIENDASGGSHADEDNESDKNEESGQRSHFGSFYLRIGAVAFGMGSLIYSGLEFGEYFELEPNSKCHNYMMAVTPMFQMIFTFTQMYFIFLNSQMAVSRVSLAKQFGLMHMIGTNLCVWLNVLIRETKHEILHFYDPHNQTVTVRHGLGNYGHSVDKFIVRKPTVNHESSEDSLDQLNSSENLLPEATGVHHRFRRGLMGPHSMYECRRVNIMGSVVNDASPFLFPCTIEFSLICAAVCYVMWKSMAKRKVASIKLKDQLQTKRPDFLPSHNAESRSPHHYTVDCAGSNKGLFTGIFALVLTIMSLILNFVLDKHAEFQGLATLEVNITELILYSTTMVGVLLGMLQFRQLRYDSRKNLELDNILLIVAQSGSFVFNVFCIIGGHLTPIENDKLVLVTPLLCLIQVVLQTLFILDASKRVVASHSQFRRKPGREIVTFLLVTNLAMWLINCLEKSRGDSHPFLLHFYGVWGWTVITRIFMPLAIFYRFHSTVCLCEIWKKAYKIR